MPRRKSFNMTERERNKERKKKTSVDGKENGMVREREITLVGRKKHMHLHDALQ
jgi:hypothetical protein